MTGQELYEAYMKELSYAHAMLHTEPLSVTDWGDLSIDTQLDYTGRAGGANLMGVSVVATAQHIHANSKDAP